MLHVRIAWWWAAVLNSSVMPTSSMTTDIQKTVPFRCWKWFGGMIPSLKLTWHLKMDGWKTSFPFRMLYFQVRTVSFREGKARRWENQRGDLYGNFFDP